MTRQKGILLFACIGGAVCLVGLVIFLMVKPHGTANGKGLPGSKRVQGIRQKTAAGPLDPVARRQLVTTGNEYGRNGDWQKAYECFRQVVESGSNDEWEWSWATGSALGAGDTNMCEKYCAQMMGLFGTRPDASLAERCAKQCLAFHCSDTLFEQAAQRADFAIGQDRKSRWAQLVKAMAEYRQGNWRGALNGLRPLETSSELEVAVQACCFGAMARHQLGDADGARQALAQADRRIWVLTWAGELGHQRYNTWDNIARGMAVRGEAELLINGKAFASPLNPASIAENRAKWQNMTRSLEVAEQLAKQSAWPPAREFYSTALQDPAFDWRVFEVKNDFLVQQMAAVFLMAEDQARYRQLVQVILERKLESLSPYTQERWAQVCVTSPDQLTPEMKTRALAFARQVYEKPGADANSWVILVRGMAEYREGRLAEAIATLQQAAAAFPPADSIAQAKSLIFQAMAHKRLGRAQEAAQATQEANNLFARQTSRNSFWPHIAYYQLAMKELLEMIASPEKPAKTTGG